MLETGYNRVLTTEAEMASAKTCLSVSMETWSHAVACKCTRSGPSCIRGIFWLIRPKSLFYPLTKSDKPSTEGESLSIGRQTLFVESVKNIIREKRLYAIFNRFSSCLSPRYLTRRLLLKNWRAF